MAPILFPQLVSLFRSEQFEAGTRARALSIFSVFITLIEHMDTVDPKVLFKQNCNLRIAKDSTNALSQFTAGSFRTKAVFSTTYNLDT